MGLPSNAPVDPYYNVNYLKKLTLDQLQTLYNSLVGTVTVSARAADTSPSTSVTLTVSDSTKYANGYRVIGYQLKIVGDAIVTAVPDGNSITIQYQEQIFPKIQAGTVLYFVPNYNSDQFKNYQWLVAQLTGQYLSCSQIESEFAFPGLFKLSDYLGLSAQISLKPIAWSQFYGITNDYYPYEVDPYNNPISTNQTLAQFIGGPTSSLTLVQSGWIKGNTIPTAQQSSYTNCVGTAMIDTVELHIGGQLIETITGEYIQNYMDMTTELQNKPALTILYGKDDYSALYNSRTYIINLPFYFYRETGLAIPLVALYRQDVEFLVRFNNFGSNYTDGADFSQFQMTPNPGNSIQIGSIVKQFNYTTLTLASGTYTGVIKDGMELLIDLSAYGVDANAIAVIDSTHPIKVNGISYSNNPDFWNSIILNSQNTDDFTISGSYPQIVTGSNTVNVITTNSTGFIVPGAMNTNATTMTFNGDPAYVSALRDESSFYFPEPIDISSITTDDDNRVYVTTNEPHKLTMGQSIYIDQVTPSIFNGRTTINVTGPYTFTYLLNYNGSGQNGRVQASPIIVSNIIGDGTTSTVYTAEPHYLASNTIVNISGMSNAIDVISSNSFTLNSDFNGTSTNGYITSYTIPSGFTLTLSTPTVSEINPGSFSSVATHPSSTSLQLWVRFTPVTVAHQGGSYDKQLLFVFPLVQPGNIQTYVPRLDSQILPFMDVTVIGEFAFLTGPELNFFRERKLTYLVSQLQISKNRLPKGSVGGYFQLNFINPVTQIQVFIRNDRNIDANRVYLNKNVDLFDYSQNGLINMGLTFNGQDAFSTSAIDSTYLGALEVLDKRTAPAYKDGIVTSNIFMYAFCMKPEAISNPSGHVNFSRIRQQILEVNMTPDLFYEKQVNIYATNYNILRVHHGLAGLLFNSSM